MCMCAVSPCDPAVLNFSTTSVQAPRGHHQAALLPAQGVLPCVDPVLQSQGLAEPDARSLIFIRITEFSNIIYKIIWENGAKIDKYTVILNYVKSVYIFVLVHFVHFRIHRVFGKNGPVSPIFSLTFSHCKLTYNSRNSAILTAILTGEIVS